MTVHHPSQKIVVSPFVDLADASAFSIVVLLLLILYSIWLLRADLARADLARAAHSEVFLLSSRLGMSFFAIDWPGVRNGGNAFGLDGWEERVFWVGL